MENNTTQRWILQGLPGSPETSQQKYIFDIGPVDYIPPYKSNIYYLHIPEKPSPDGDPKFPEQDEWVNNIIRSKSIKAESIWCSHWKFKNKEEADKFGLLLNSLGAEKEKFKDDGWTLRNRCKT